MMSFLWTSLGHVAVGTAVPGLAVSSGLFPRAPGIHTGLAHYAEGVAHAWPQGIARFTHMPANTLVNLGYTGIGAFWLHRTYRNVNTGLYSWRQGYVACVFGWMSVVYGPIQLARILTQSHGSGVLDQWVTLPIFAWVVVWCRHLQNKLDQTEEGPPTPSPLTTTDLSIMTLSVASYGLVFVVDRGFEVALGGHIVAAVWHAVRAYRHAHPNHAALRSLLKGVVCCSGFVGLKLLDHHLATLHPFFTCLSGHFWSKVCDFLQIHYCFQFFQALAVPDRLTTKDKL